MHAALTLNKSVERQESDSNDDDEKIDAKCCTLFPINIGQRYEDGKVENCIFYGLAVK